MNLLSYLRQLFSTLFHRSDADSDLDEELRLHLARHADDLELSGLSRPEAERQARIGFGSYEKSKETVREQRPGFLLETLVNDASFALRLLRKNPAFTTIAILTLALGIGANTAIFELLDAIRLRALSIEKPQQLAEIQIVGGHHGLANRFRHPRVRIGTLQALDRAAIANPPFSNNQPQIHVLASFDRAQRLIQMAVIRSRSRDYLDLTA